MLLFYHLYIVSMEQWLLFLQNENGFVRFVQLNFSFEDGRSNLQFGALNMEKAALAFFSHTIAQLGLWTNLNTTHIPCLLMKQVPRQANMDGKSIWKAFVQQTFSFNATSSTGTQREIGVN